MNLEVERRLNQITELPTLPVVVQKLNSAVSDPKVDANRIAELLKDDVAISAKLLKVVNSALYSGKEPITSIQMAVARLGMNGVRNVVTSVAIFSAFGSSDQDAFDRNEFWRHCIFAGHAAAVLHNKANCPFKRPYPKDMLHLCGVMHDVGRLVLDQFFHDQFMEALAVGEQEMLPLCDAERDVIGADHAEVGAWLATRWSTTEALVQSIRWHHDPSQSGDEYRYLVSLCHAANYVCNYQQIGWSGDVAPHFVDGVWADLGIGVSEVYEVADEIHEVSKESELLAAFG